MSSRVVLLTPPWNYVATCEAAKEAVWLCNFLMDLQVVPKAQEPMSLYCDNSEAVANFKELRSRKRGKHIERRYHLLRGDCSQRRHHCE